MKKIIILFLSLFLISTVKPVLAQQGSITIGLVATECNQIIVQWNSTYNFVGVGNNGWTQSTITITWPSAQGANALGTIIPIAAGFTGWQYNGAAVLNGSNYQREIILLNGGYTQNIPIGITEIIGIKLVGSGTGNFTIANPNGNTDISHFTFSGNMWSGAFSPSSVTGVPFANAVRWNGTRWCGGSSTVYFGEPSSADQTVNCFITGANGVLHTVDAKVNQLTINSGANLTVAVNASLSSYGTVTNNGVNGLNVDANSSGTGSYISRASTFTYGTGASSTVKQYFTDNVTQVSFHVHLVGPLVNNPQYETDNSEKGVYLSEFNLVGSSTFAYVFDNPTGTWVNVVPLNYPVPTTLGLALSTTTNASQTMSMTGKMIHGTINTNNGPTVVNAGYNLISNPYPSGVNLNTFLSTNYGINGDVGPDVWAWEGANNTEGGNYSNYNYESDIGTGGLTDKTLRIGQGFFTDFIGAGNGSISFALSMRVHANGILLKEDPANVLRLYVKGNDFSDETVILFKSGGTYNYGFGDSEKWPSMYEEATEAWTVSSDNKNLAINNLEPILTEHVSVPMSFKCGTEGTYTIEAGSIETFETGTEIWLEDQKLKGDWYNLIQNPVYEFTGSPSDLLERFIIHFFGPTGIDDPQADIKSIRIYGWGQDAYIVNRGNETIKEYVAYDMMGREMHRGSLPNSTVNKVWVSNVSGYYIVKAITKEGRIYTDKVYITK